MHLHLIDHIKKQIFSAVSFTSLNFLIFLKKISLQRAPPLPINLTQPWSTDLGMAQTRITSSITGVGVASGGTYNFWQKYRGGKTSKIKWLFESSF